MRLIRTVLFIHVQGLHTTLLMQHYSTLCKWQGLSKARSSYCRYFSLRIRPFWFESYSKNLLFVSLFLTLLNKLASARVAKAHFILSNYSFSGGKMSRYKVDICTKQARAYKHDTVWLAYAWPIKSHTDAIRFGL